MTTATYAGRSVLVTGGTGFIGQHLVRRLIEERARVVTFARGSARIAGAEHLRGDVRKAQAVAAVVERRFDAVFHLAGASGQSGLGDDASCETNRSGVINVLESIRRYSPETSFCFASSRLVYGRSQYLPVDEEHPQQPLSAYAVDKRDGETSCVEYAKRWGVRAVALRLSNPYGPHAATGHRRYNIANLMIDELCRGKIVTVYGRGEQLRDYVYIDDAVRALMLAASSEAAFGRVFNVGAGVGTPLIDFVQTTMLAAGGGAYECLRWPEHALSVETGDYVASIDHIRSHLGWAPRVSLMEGIARTVAVQRRAATRTRQVTSAIADNFEQDLEAAA